MASKSKSVALERGWVLIQRHPSIGRVNLTIGTAGAKAECLDLGIVLVTNDNNSSATMYNASNRSSFTFERASWTGRRLDVLATRNGTDVVGFVARKGGSVKVFGVDAFRVSLVPPDRRVLSWQVASRRCKVTTQVDCVLSNSLKVSDATKKLLLKFYALPQQVDGIPISVKFLTEDGDSKSAVKTESIKPVMISPQREFGLPEGLRSVERESQLMSDEAEIRDLLSQ